ncbi:hypothetical protein [Halovenus sp. HT40]|uniref:hypothetical protein n=1 Tax=Halovenus sp. HT40 TaxID=3126691 RepID=UPI00300F479E
MPKLDISGSNMTVELTSTETVAYEESYGENAEVVEFEDTRELPHEWIDPTSTHAIGKF